MKSKFVRLTKVCLLVLASLLPACDTFEGDLIPKEKQFVLNAAATDYYVLSNSPAVIDLETIVTSLFSGVTIRVSETPKRGTLTFLNEVLLKYTPSTSFTQGIDEFKLAFASANGSSLTQTITVHMASDTGEFPCALYAVEDHAYATPQKPVSIKILHNDRICGIGLTDVEASISVNPLYGQAILRGDSIIYTADAGFQGVDEIVYKIAPDNSKMLSANNSLPLSYGVVEISVSSEACPFFILDTYTLNLTDNTNDPFSKGECAGGYDIPIWGIVAPPCDHYGVYIEEVTQTKFSGTICFGQDGRFAYHPDQAKTPKNDSARYEICVNGQCKEVTINIVREPPG